MNTPASASSTTLRPRNQRRIYEDDGDNAGSHAAPLTHHGDTASVSARSSRAVSPIPGIGPSQAARTATNKHRSQSSSRFLGVPSLRGSEANTSNFASGLWETSWSSLRSIASDLIGSDTSRDSSPSTSYAQKRRPLQALPPQWGPSAPPDKELGSGTRERRRAEVEAKKRERLLIANGHSVLDGSGRYKRRDSDERERASIPPAEAEDKDALVYLHNVKPGDTLAGVMIKYNCQPNIFRKANRMWPNDSIQVRNTVVLPVDACGVKGQKILSSELASYDLVEHPGDEIVPGPRSMRPSWGEIYDTFEDKETPLSSLPTSPSISITLFNCEEPLWRHDSWVLIEGFPEAVEIIRMSRRALGYFPRNRRKSQSFSDLGTPSTSFELPRSNYLSNSPRQTARSRSGSNPNFANLHGPGGVGTMSRNVRSPGPANDGLNKLFPTLEQKVAPRSSSVPGHSGSSHPNGLENVGGAIEGWVRKLANKASTSLLPPTPRGNAGVGDLIELSEDVFNLEQDRHNGGQRDRSTTARTGFTTGDCSAEQEQTLHERFPPRGRVVGDASKRWS